MRRAPLRAWLVGGVLALGACAPPAGTTASSPPAAATGVADQAAGASTAPAAPGAVTASSAGPSTDVPWVPGVVEPPPEGVEPWGVWIPRLGVEASLAGLGLDDAGELDVPDRPEVAGWYVGGPRPGEVGPTVVAGHVDSTTGPAVFARLHELREGDVAHLVYRDGFVVTYRVRGVERYGKDAFPTEAVYGDTPVPALRLITCGGEFDRSAGSYRDNVVAYADVLGTWRYDV
ncbi:MAG: class F sortase [Actinobacteria bacterium]|nr:class F sortase [Actinomycetota bacterium]